MQAAGAACELGTLFFMLYYYIICYSFESFGTTLSPLTLSEPMLVGRRKRVVSFSAPRHMHSPFPLGGTASRGSRSSGKGTCSLPS